MPRSRPHAAPRGPGAGASWPMPSTSRCPIGAGAAGPTRAAAAIADAEAGQGRLAAGPDRAAACAGAYRIRAIDLAFDLIGRFGSRISARLRRRLDRGGGGGGHAFRPARPAPARPRLPLRRRCRRMTGCGRRRNHDRDDALARLAIVPMVLEARGLDVTPPRSTGSRRPAIRAPPPSSRRIYRDEIRACGGRHELVSIHCEIRGVEPISDWRWLIKNNFKGALKASIQRLSA